MRHEREKVVPVEMRTAVMTEAGLYTLRYGKPGYEVERVYREALVSYEGQIMVRVETQASRIEVG